MKELQEIKQIIMNDTEETYEILTTNKKTGWKGCASFTTKGEPGIIVFEGNPDGSDDAKHTYEEFIKNYWYEIKEVK